MEWDTTTAEDLDGILTQIRLNEKTNYTRTLLILCIISIVKEYQISKKYELKVAEERCHRKLQCLKLYIETTTEPFIAFKDIENFLVAFFGQKHKDLILQTLKDSLTELDPETPTYSQPRTLQDLARSKIRDSLTYSGVLPDKVSKLHLPNRLKKFILFHETDIWKSLKADTKFAKLQNYVDYFMQTRDDL